MPRLRILYPALTAAALLLAACNGDDATPTSEPGPTATSTPPPTATVEAPASFLGRPALANAEYATDLPRTGLVQLVDRRYSESAAPGSAQTITVELGNLAAGDLDGDGDADAAAILIESGGAGTFFALHAVRSDAGRPVDAARVLLGDRVSIEALMVDGDEIVVAFADRPADAAFADPPSIPKIVRYRLDGDALALVREFVSEAPVAAAPCDNLDARVADASFVFVTNVGPGTVLSSGISVVGCSRTFESQVDWKVLDREGAEVGRGFTMGGGVDGAASFAFDVEYAVSETQVGHLVVAAPDPSGGEGFPPVEHRIPVLLVQKP